MAGSELLGLEELESIKELFQGSPAVLYRYHPKNFMVKRFENAMAQKLGVAYCHAVSSGTAAIETALFSAGIRAGDEVITTAFTFIAPIEAMLKIGAHPVCVEIDETFNLSVENVRKAITPKTKAVCAVPMWGACDNFALNEICQTHQLVFLEDAAQCLGGTLQGRPVGTFGVIGSFSLDFGKTLTAGEGGFVVTNSEEVYKLASEYADHGHMHIANLPRGKDPVRFPGFNYRMSELTGAVAVAQLNKMDFILSAQRKRFSQLKSELANLKNIRIRGSSDTEGEPGDTLILTFEEAPIAQQIVERLTEEKINTKILPEAFDWHFAGSWKHVWREKQERWPKTYDLLTRSVALPISVLSNPEWDERVLAVLKKRVG